MKSLYYECYEAMAEKQIDRIIQRVQRECGVSQIRAIHRVGDLNIQDAAVVIEVQSAHRAEAYVASRKMIDTIKHEVPIWKKEFYEDGSSEWTLCNHHEGIAV